MIGCLRSVTRLSAWSSAVARSSLGRVSPTLPLPRDEVHVWYADPDEVDYDVAHARTLLGDNELTRLDRHRFERDRRIFLATRVLVRTTLSRYAGVPARSWRFAPNAHGCPEIIDPVSPLRFNLSNTTGLVACVVAQRAVGIDVENLAREAPLDIAPRFLSPAELNALAALPRAEQPRRIFAYWTLKESYIKARGLGLALPLRLVSFLLEGDGPRIELDASLRDDPSRWRFIQLYPTEQHVGSLCLEQLPAAPRVISRHVSLHDLLA